jgi:hypothetical protein
MAEMGPVPVLVGDAFTEQWMAAGYGGPDPDEDDGERQECHVCGSTETADLFHTDPSGREMSVTICAGCGSDEP